jgi:hypothetical protein
MAFKLNPFTSRLDTVRNQMLWGSFYDTTQQVAAVANTAYPIGINSTDSDSNGINIASGSRITFSRSGVYSFTYSKQFVNTNTSIHDVDVWLRKNNSDVVASNSSFSVISSHGGTDGHVIGCVNYVLKLVANDYLEHGIFEFDPCDLHYHFQHYENYLFGNITGRKTGFCLQTTWRYHNNEYVSFNTPSSFCDYQGISAGWGNISFFIIFV